MLRGLEELERRVRRVVDRSPDADRVGVAAHLLRETPAGPAIDQAFDRLSPPARELLLAHGHWPGWSRKAADLVDMSHAAAAAILLELEGAGWATREGTFPLAVQAWLHAREAPDLELVRRVADRTEAAFHHRRCAGHGDSRAKADLDHWSAWGSMPEVAEWAPIANDVPLGDSACLRCLPWAAIEASRRARWRQWYDQSIVWLDTAERHASTPRARYFIRFLRAVYALQEGEPSGTRLARELGTEVPCLPERFFLYQAQAMVARYQGEDPRVPLRRGLALAQGLGFRFREMHLRLLLAIAEWPDGHAMRTELEQIDVRDLDLTARDRWNLHWAWTRTHLAEQDLPGALHHAQTILADPSLAGLSAGGAWGVVSLAAREQGDLDRARTALVEARRHLTGPRGPELRTWFERVHGGGPWFPLPGLAWTLPVGWVARDGIRFAVDGDEVDLSRSPVSIAILRALAQGPCTTEQLIEAAWPADRSDPHSLRNRLHAALRTLRRKGLDAHLRFEEGAYTLQRLQLRDVYSRRSSTAE